MTNLVEAHILGEFDIPSIDLEMSEKLPSCPDEMACILVNSWLEDPYIHILDSIDNMIESLESQLSKLRKLRITIEESYGNK